jgi:hypothetical protein
MERDGGGVGGQAGNVIFKFCPREANKTAHKLAKFGFLSKNSCNWDDELPSFLLSNIINDLTVIDD